MTLLEADIEIVCPGVLEVLSVGKGDLKLTWDPTDPEDVAKARSTINEMLRAGYGIFVETDDGPARVKAFSATTMSYIISEVAEGVELPTGPPAAPALPPGPAPATAGQPAPKRRGRPRTKDKEVPVAGSKATAVGRTAGG